MLAHRAEQARRRAEQLAAWPAAVSCIACCILGLPAVGVRCACAAVAGARPGVSQRLPRRRRLAGGDGCRCRRCSVVSPAVGLLLAERFSVYRLAAMSLLLLLSPADAFSPLFPLSCRFQPLLWQRSNASPSGCGNAQAIFASAAVIRLNGNPPSSFSPPFAGRWHCKLSFRSASSSLRRQEQSKCLMHAPASSPASIDPDLLLRRIA